MDKESPPLTLSRTSVSTPRSWGLCILSSMMFSDCNKGRPAFKSAASSWLKMMNSVVLIRPGPRLNADKSGAKPKERRTEKIWYPLTPSSRLAEPSSSARSAISMMSPLFVPTLQMNWLIGTCVPVD